MNVEDFPPPATMEPPRKGPDCKLSTLLTTFMPGCPCAHCRWHRAYVEHKHWGDENCSADDCPVHTRRTPGGAR